MKKGLAFFITTILSIGVFANAYHPYSISWVNAEIHENKVSLSIKISAEDLLYFHHLKLDSMFSVSREDLESAAWAHLATLFASFTILDQHKNSLPAKVYVSSLASLGLKDRFDVMDLMKCALHYKMEFNRAHDTELLTFQQTLSKVGIPAVTLLSINKNGEQLVHNVELSNDKPFTISPHAVSLGLVSDINFMLSYLTLSDTKVIHELTIPFTILKSFLLSANKQKELGLDEIKEFIASNSAVEINGKTIVPEIAMLDFQSYSEHAQNDTLLVNIRVEYSLKSLPKDIAITWEGYNWQVRWFKSLIDAFGEPTEHQFSRFQPTFKTERRLKIKPEGQ